MNVNIIRIAIICILILLLSLLVYNFFYSSDYCIRFTSDEELLDNLKKGHYATETAVDELLRRGPRSDIITELNLLAHQGNVWEQNAANIILFRFRDHPEIRLNNMLQSVALPQSADFFILSFSRFNPSDCDFAPMILETYQFFPEGRKTTLALYQISAVANVRNELVFKRINSELEQDRLAAARAVYSIGLYNQSMRGCNELIGASVGLLNDPCVEVRMEAAKSLSMHGCNIRSTQALFQALSDDGSELVRLEALKAIMCICEGRDLHEALNIASKDNSELVRKEALHTKTIMIMPFIIGLIIVIAIAIIMALTRMHGFRIGRKSS